MALLIDAWRIRADTYEGLGEGRASLENVACGNHLPLQRRMVSTDTDDLARLKRAERLVQTG